MIEEFIVDEYVIVESYYMIHFLEDVNRMLSEKWQPQGGVFVHHEHFGPEDTKGHTVFYQAMVKYRSDRTVVKAEGNVMPFCPPPRGSELAS